MKEERRVGWRAGRKRRKGRVGWDISENRCREHERETSTGQCVKTEKMVRKTARKVKFEKKKK